jgi:hypothetical protein
MDSSKKKQVESRRKQSDRIRRYRARQSEIGLASVNLWLPLPLRDRIKALAAQHNTTLGAVVTEMLQRTGDPGEMVWPTATDGNGDMAAQDAGTPTGAAGPEAGKSRKPRGRKGGKDS